MSMSRRQFIGVVGAATAVTQLSPLSAITLENDLYSNERLGFSIGKAPTWQFARICDFARVLDKQTSTQTDPELHRDLREISGEPILVISKYPLEHDAFTPVVQVYASQPSLSQIKSFESHCAFAPHALAPFHPNYEVTQEAIFSTLCGFQAATYAMQFDYECDGVIHPTRCEVVDVLTDRAHFGFQFFGSVTGPEQAIDDLRHMRESIRLW